MRKAIFRDVELIRSLILCVIAGFVLNACDGLSDSSSAETADRTILVYSIGSDISKGAERDLNNMMNNSTSSQINVVVAAGGGVGITHNTSNKIQLDWTQLTYVAKDQSGQLSTSPQGQKNMADTSTFISFVEWAMKTYPAKNYAIVFNDHGSGPVKGFGSDIVFRATQKGNLTVSDIANSLAQVESDTGSRFDLIGFDACLMAGAEVASALSPYADYLVASEDVEIGSWNYVSILQGLSANPTMNGEALGESILNAARQKNAGANGEQNPGLTLSAIDLSKVAAVNQAIDTLGSELVSSLALDPTPPVTPPANSQTPCTTNWSCVALAAHGADKFDLDFVNQGPDVVDLASFAGSLATTNLGQQSPALVSADTVQNLKTALAGAVVDQALGSARTTSSGLTIYVPSSSIRNETAVPTYLTIPLFSKNYQKFVSNYASLGRTVLADATDIRDASPSQDQVNGTLTVTQPLSSTALWLDEMPVAAILSSSTSAAITSIAPASDPTQIVISRTAQEFLMNGEPVSVVPAEPPAPGSIGGSTSIVPVCFRSDADTAASSGYLIVGISGTDVSLLSRAPILTFDTAAAGLEEVDATSEIAPQPYMEVDPETSTTFAKWDWGNCSDVSSQSYKPWGGTGPAFTTTSIPNGTSVMLGFMDITDILRVSRPVPLSWQ
jgi:hypothetical protein